MAMRDSYSSDEGSVLNKVRESAGWDARALESAGKALDNAVAARNVRFLEDRASVEGLPLCAVTAAQCAADTSEDEAVDPFSTRRRPRVTLSALVKKGHGRPQLRRKVSSSSRVSSNSAVSDVTELAPYTAPASDRDDVATQDVPRRQSSDFDLEGFEDFDEAYKIPPASTVGPRPPCRQRSDMPLGLELQPEERLYKEKAPSRRAWTARPQRRPEAEGMQAKTSRRPATEASSRPTGMPLSAWTPELSTQVFQQTSAPIKSLGLVRPSAPHGKRNTKRAARPALFENSEPAFSAEGVEEKPLAASPAQSCWVRKRYFGLDDDELLLRAMADESDADESDADESADHAPDHSEKASAACEALLPDGRCDDPERDGFAALDDMEGSARPAPFRFCVVDSRRVASSADDSGDETDVVQVLEEGLKRRRTSRGRATATAEEIGSLGVARQSHRRPEVMRYRRSGDMSHEETPRMPSAEFLSTSADFFTLFAPDDESEAATAETGTDEPLDISSSQSGEIEDPEEGNEAREARTPSRETRDERPAHAKLWSSASPVSRRPSSRARSADASGSAGAPLGSSSEVRNVSQKQPWMARAPFRV